MTLSINQFDLLIELLKLGANSIFSDKSGFAFIFDEEVNDAIELANGNVLFMKEATKEELEKYGEDVHWVAHVNCPFTKDISDQWKEYDVYMKLAY